jgi:2-succinyl-5-enolpyruvyl-6-hydroxy-3-cyclohexene-1-carboxylate synthase
MESRYAAHYLIDQLIQQGVLDFCIAPGSRSGPLALAAARHPKARTTVHFDERGLAFYALGISVVSPAPAVLIVTSGTAVGNLLPAVMEAYHSHIPLLLLTADRPPELRDCAANQATDQIKIFQNFVLWQTDLPCNNDSAFFRAQANYALFHALRGGPVHLNCPFREPLFHSPEVLPEGIPQQQRLPTLSIRHTLPSIRRGLMLIGRMSFHRNLTPLFQLAKQLRWPIFADLLSSARPSCQLIRHFDYALRLQNLPLPDFILYFGERFTSKIVLDWIQKHCISLLHVSAYPNRVEPLHADRIWADPEMFCQQLSFSPSQDDSWLAYWQLLDQQIEKRIEECFLMPHTFTEPDLMRLVGEQLPEDWDLFLANSMPIRDAELFLFPKQMTRFFANRGLSGIDGQIATAMGIAAQRKKPLCAILGDQSCLHDLNSLPLLHTVQTPFLLIIVNNFGGGIFSHLPFAQEPEHFERLFGAAHSFQFEQAAQMFQIPYRRGFPLFPCTQPTIVEICTSRQENTKFRKMLLEHVCSSFSTAF